MYLVSQLTIKFLNGGHLICIPFITAGCSKCKKEFSRTSFGSKPDYSGFDTSLWEPRCCEETKQQALNVCQGKTQTERESLSSMYGVRYSELHSLPYFDPVRMHVVDPMHNLFLGIYVL